MTIFLVGLAAVGAFLIVAAFVGWVYLRWWLAPDLGWGWSDIPRYVEKGAFGLLVFGLFIALCFAVGLMIVGGPA